MTLSSAAPLPQASTTGIKVLFELDELCNRPGCVEPGDAPRPHWHCSGCFERIFLVGQNELPEDANVCTMGHVKHVRCECGDLPSVGPITTPLASVKDAVEQSVPPISFDAYSAWCDVGERLRTDISECVVVDDLSEAEKFLVEIRERVADRLKEIAARKVALTTRALGFAS